MAVEFVPSEFSEVRLGLGMSQREVALAAGVSVGTVRNAESGLHAPRRRTAIALAHAVGCTLLGVGGAVGDHAEEDLERWDALERLLCIARAKRRSEEER